ncbi:O-acyltransferase WSD1 [Apostasia shenzhenica]|uniref:O-acyltransferase WSD1 n=1 Tax=Apostasia shenzhenica TaxID=1088818 RepID=A0A2I0B0A3_9ASPA|nr:O-acyltransferase WSD1 [Apostasia shenzhenica]
MGAAEAAAATVEQRRPLTVGISRPSWLSSPAAAAAEEIADGEPLSPHSRIFRQPQLNCHVISILGFGKIIGKDEMKAGLEATLVRHPRFSSIQARHAPVKTDNLGVKLVALSQVTGKAGVRWVRTTVNLDEHVVYKDLGHGECTDGDRLVEDYASGLCRSPLDPSRPLWDVHILPIRSSEAASVAIFRFHHSLGDGVSLASLLLDCTRRTSDPESLPSIPGAGRRPAGIGSRRFIFWLWATTVYAWNTLVDIFLFFASATVLKDTRTAIKGTEGIESRPKRFVHRALCLDDLKAIKSTINDVLVGVLSAALSRYLSRNSGGILPKNLRIKSIMFVNIRPSTGIHELAKMMKKGSGAEWGNRIGYILLPLPVMKCDDPLEYVRKGEAIAERKKNSWGAKFIYTSCSLIVKTLGLKAAILPFYKAVSNTTLAMSNLVGPTEEVGFCGSPLVYIATSVYGHPQALTVHFQSYMNKMEVVLAADELAIPNPHELLDDIADSFELIKDAAAAVPTSG